MGFARCPFCFIYRAGASFRPTTSFAMSLEKEKDSEKPPSDITSDVVNFGGEDGLPPPPQLTQAEEKKLWRKVDLKLLPVLALMYLLSFIDRGKVPFYLILPMRFLIVVNSAGNIGSILSTISRNTALIFIMIEGNAKLEGLVTQLDLTGNRYNIALVGFTSVRNLQ